MPGWGVHLYKLYIGMYSTKPLWSALNGVRVSRSMPHCTLAQIFMEHHPLPQVVSECLVIVTHGGGEEVSQELD